jgi:hypothetical protein
VAVAVMVQLVPTGDEAVNSPLDVMLPQLAAQVEARFAVNCCVVPCGVEAVAGVTVSGSVTVAVVDAAWPLPSVAVAVMVQEPAAIGAVNSPAELMVPQLAAHVAAALAVNCWVAPSLSVGFNGLMENETTAATVSYA